LRDQAQNAWQLVAILTNDHPSDEDLSLGTPAGPAYVELQRGQRIRFLAGASRRRSWLSARPSWYAGDGAGRSQWSVWRRALSYCRAEVPWRAHIGAEIAVSSFGKRLTPAAWLPHRYPEEPPRLLLLLRIADGLPEFMPTHHALQDARGDQDRGPATLTISKSSLPG